MGTVRVFNHHLHAAYLWLAGIEGLLFFASFYLVAVVFSTLGTAEFPLQYDVRAVTFAMIASLSMAAMGMYKQHMREGFGGVLRRTLGAFLFTALTLSVLNWLIPQFFLWHNLVFQTVTLALVFSLMGRYVFFKVVEQGNLKRRVLVYGAGRKAETTLSSMRRASDRRSFEFVGFIHIDGEDDAIDSHRVVALPDTGEALYDYVKANRIDQIVIAADDKRNRLPIDQLLKCKLCGVQVEDVVSFFEREAGKIMLDFVTPGWMVFSDGFHLSTLSTIAKRSLDLLASFVLLIFAWPVMLLTVLAIWAEDGIGAPIVYRQQRVGLDGKIFNVLKFRSMRCDAEKNGAQWAKKNDDRITKVGRIIRKCRIDELPQIINVLVGDMAFIGPRPERPEFVAELSQEIPHYSARHYVKPGITGWAQLCYPYGADQKAAGEKLQFDLYYVKNHSLFLDILIAVTTVEVVLFGKGAH